jgi:hypothetical protein
MSTSPQQLNEITCAVCHVSIWVQASAERKLREEGGFFHCINGHSQHFVKPRIVELEKSLANEKHANEVLRGVVANLEKRLAKKPKKK